MGSIATFPFRLAFRIGGTGIKIIGFLFGFFFKTLGFIARRFSLVFIGVLIGLFLGRKQIAKKLSELSKG
jgi:hypothetical protein